MEEVSKMERMVASHLRHFTPDGRIPVDDAVYLAVTCNHCSPCTSHPETPRYLFNTMPQITESLRDFKMFNGYAGRGGHKTTVSNSSVAPA
jgi:hypothetical protein